MSVISPDLRFHVTPEGAMILDVAADEIITLNATGGYVWARLKEGKDANEIAAGLAKETGHDAAVVANDVHELVEQLTNMKLVTF